MERRASRHAAAARLLLCTALALAAAGFGSEGNLLPNPGFEKGMKGWETAGEPDVVVDPAVKHGGRQAARLAPHPGATAELLKLCAMIPARPGETYRARFWVLAGPLALILHPHATVWFDDAELVRLRPAPAPESTAVRLALRQDQTLNADWRGFGCQGEILLHLPRSLQQGYNEEDRRLVEDRIRAMRPQFIRLTVRLSDWEPELGRTTPDNDTIKDLKATIALYQEVGADVQLTEWGHALPDWCRPAGSLHGVMLDGVSRSRGIVLSNAQEHHAGQPAGPGV